MIQTFTARSGARSLKVDGAALHSPYDPVREAERFVETALAGEIPSTVIVLGEGLGYITEALSRISPAAKLVRVHYSSEIHNAAGQGATGSWHPNAGRELADFLRANLSELEVEGMKILEWPPSARIFPEISRRANESLRQVVQELNGSFVTTAAVGRLWIRNSIANFLFIHPFLSGRPCREDRLVVIAASGPSLERAAPLLARNRGAFDLWTLPSSALVLRDAGLEPDLVVMTDPGYYSITHLQFAGVRCPIAMPLSAARGCWELRRAAAPLLPSGVFPLSQGVFFEQELLDCAGIRAPLIAPHGTVAATALELALASTHAPVILAGLDFCMQDLISHARPNAFDRTVLREASRTAPHTSVSFRRAEGQHAERLSATGAARASPALRTYAGWFAGLPVESAPRLFRLFPSEVPIPGMHPLDVGSFEALCRSALAGNDRTRFPPDCSVPSVERRVDIVRRMIEGWARVVEEGRAAPGSPPGLAAFARSPVLVSLAYFIEPRRLLDAKRKGRLGDEEGARVAAAGVLEGCADFLHSLAGKVRGAA